MNWLSYNLTISFYSDRPRELIDDLLLGVVGLFRGSFTGHAKCIVTIKNNQFFASTTGFPAVVEWTPPLPGASNAEYQLEAVWIFLTGQGPVPTIECFNDVIAEVAARYQIKLGTGKVPSFRGWFSFLL